MVEEKNESIGGMRIFGPGKMKEEECSVCGGKIKVLTEGIGVNYVKCEKCGCIKSFLRIGTLPQRGMKKGS